MEKLIADVDTEVLVEIVRVAQKRQLRGSQGDWKEFLDRHDAKLGSALSDPAKRSTDILVSFLKTFTQKNHVKFFGNIIKLRSQRRAMEQFIKASPDQESPEHILVRLTMEHPNYIQHYSFPSYDEGWMIISPGKFFKAMISKSMLAIDCEMVLCDDGTEAVVQVCAIDHNLVVKLEQLVNPNKGVADYRTSITGISAEDLAGVTCSLADVQKSLKKLLSNETILVGHSLHNDLRALRIDHPRVIDTSYIFKLIDLPATYSPSLNSLCQSILGYELRKEGEPHNCMCDAEATMKLAIAKLKKTVDEPIAVECKHAPNVDPASLLLHKIPVGIPCEELSKLFPADYSAEIQSDLRVKGQSYSTYAVFKDASVADEAFRRVIGQENKDSCGRGQKRVFLKLSTGQHANFYVRKMLPDGMLSNGNVPKKRPAEDETEYRSVQDDETEGPKKQKLSLHQCEHAQEIDNLRQEILKMKQKMKKKFLRIKQKIAATRNEE